MILPVLLDSQPSYLQGSATPASLLLSPFWRATLLDHLAGRLPECVSQGVTVLPTFDGGESYQRLVRQTHPRVEAVVPAAAFIACLPRYEPSDWLLFIDPRVATEEPHSDLLLKGLTDSPWRVQHLLVLNGSVGGTRERIECDSIGRAQRIRRYYDAATWTLYSTVSCSLVPVSCLLTAEDVPLSSLAALRHALAMRGVPSRDVPVRDRLFDLVEERHLLSLSQRIVLKRSAGGPRSPNGVRPRYQGARCSISDSARLIGPVVLHDDVVIADDAVVVGPTIIGSGARIERRAIVAQSVISPRTEIPAYARVNHRVVVKYVKYDDDTRFTRSDARPVRHGPPASEHLSTDVGDVRDERRRPAGYPRVKAVADAAVALLGLVALTPLLLIIAVLVKLESRGTVLYSDLRESKHGRPFRCLKFRTMVTGAHAAQRDLMEKNQVDGPQFKIEGDPRVTRVGRWLRMISFDELPQLVNVALGQMSLVGPRPSPFGENQTCVPWREGRLSVRPGITGLWQVCRHDRTQGDFHQWIYYDLAYVQHMSLWVDLKILLATLATLGGKGHVPVSWIIRRRRLEKA